MANNKYIRKTVNMNVIDFLFNNKGSFSSLLTFMEEKGLTTLNEFKELDKNILTTFIRNSNTSMFLLDECETDTNVPLFIDNAHSYSMAYNTSYDS